MMPKWGLTMEEGTIAEWMIGEGEEIARGDIIATVETEKTNVDLPSPFSGIVARLLVADGDTVEAGAPLAIIAADADEADRIRMGTEGAGTPHRDPPEEVLDAARA